MIKNKRNKGLGEKKKKKKRKHYRQIELYRIRNSFLYNNSKKNNPLLSCCWANE